MSCPCAQGGQKRVEHGIKEDLWEGVMKMSGVASAVVILSVGIFAKDKTKSIDDYPMRVTVKNTNAGRNDSTHQHGVVVGTPAMTVTDGDFYYNLECRSYHLCLTVPIGTQLEARVVDNSMEVVTFSKKAKIHTFSYKIDSKIPVGTAEVDPTDPSKVIHPDQPCKTWIFDGKNAVCKER
jgi:hypothetical protein